MSAKTLFRKLYKYRLTFYLGFAFYLGKYGNLSYIGLEMFFPLKRLQILNLRNYLQLFSLLQLQTSHQSANKSYSFHLINPIHPVLSMSIAIVLIQAFNISYMNYHISPLLVTFPLIYLLHWKIMEI